MCVSGALTSLTDKVLLLTETVRKAQRWRTSRTNGRREGDRNIKWESACVTFCKKSLGVFRRRNIVFLPRIHSTSADQKWRCSCCLLTLSLILFLFLSLSSSALILSHALFNPCCASLSLSPSLSLFFLMICGSCVYAYTVCSCDWAASGGRLLAPARTCNIRKHFFSRQGFHRRSDVLRVPSVAPGDSAAHLCFVLFVFFTFYL